MKRNAAASILVFSLGASCWTADALATKIGIDEEPSPVFTKKPAHTRIAPDEAPGKPSQAAPSAHRSNLDAGRNHEILAPRFGPNYQLPPAHSSAPERVDGSPPSNMRMDLHPRVGMQWSTEEQKPSLEYRMSDNGVIRLHGAHRGAQVRMQWKF